MNLRVKSKIWIELNNNEFLGEGKVRLLKAIDETGSISKGAKAINMPYKKAWHLLDGVNKTSKRPVILKSIGGAGGGGTRLTDYGRALVIAFEDMNIKCREFLEIQLQNVKQL